MIGTTLSHYRITEKLGAGGMGEVYRAEDTTLKRQVALKVLPELFAGDPERLARFKREAELLASLNHPNIATIYGLEESAGKLFLVMELAEGETLAQRIAKGPMPLDETLDTCRQIAEGLEAAHEKGVIHRDLKPANVKITPEGKVKILDFGLAKAMAGETPAADSSQSPTITEGMTRPGVILGTTAYMSPEQAKGKAVDKRADIWAFGCILYEMLTGKRPFAGEDVSDTLAAILKSDPDWTALPSATPAGILRLLRRCLQKDRKRRLADTSDAQLEIDEASGCAPEQQMTTGSARSAHWERLAWTAGILVSLAIGALAVWYLRPSQLTTTVPATRFIFNPQTESPSLNLSLASSSRPRLSPDGQWLVFRGNSPHGWSLWLRENRSGAVRELSGTAGATYHFWSPDSRSVAFSSSGELKRIGIDSTLAAKICELPSGGIISSGSWGIEGDITFSMTQGIFRVTASGGTPLQITSRDEAQNDWRHVLPSFLPDGRRFLFAISRVDENRSGLYVGSLDGSAPKLVLAGVQGGWYAPPGYLLFARQQQVLVQAFDWRTLALKGDPLPLLENALLDSISVSNNGLIAYSNRMEANSYALTWFDRAGRKLGVVGEPGEYSTFDLSKDGRRLVVNKYQSGVSANLWIIDLLRDSTTRLTSDEASHGDPRWSPNEGQVAFDSTRDPARSPFRVSLSDSKVEQVLKWDGYQFALDDWSPDGRYLLFHDYGLELWALPLEGDRKPELVVRSLLGQLDQASFSPDGRWIAYNTDESGRYEVKVVRFPSTGEKLQITNTGGVQPTWRGDGKELFYLALDGTMMAVDVLPGTSLECGKAHLLFKTQLSPSAAVEQYLPAPDGTRFLIRSLIGEPAKASSITIIVNWPGLLNK